jgi:hypothetical protein
MQEILCTQCQSQNPRYTKFCLTCGSVLTIPRSVPVRPVTGSEAAIISENRSAALAMETPQAWSSPKAETPASSSSDEQKESGWLSNLKRFWSF